MCNGEDHNLNNFDESALRSLLQTMQSFHQFRTSIDQKNSARKVN